MKYKLLTAIVSLAMVISMAPGITADESPSDEIVAAVDTPNGVEYLTQDEVNQLEDNHGECSAEGPLEAYCLSVDEGVRTALFFGHRCDAGPSYTGVVESRLVHDGDDRTWACTFEEGQLLSTQGDGEWPDVGDTFSHEGYSYFTDTYNSGVGPVFEPISDGEPTGVPGGIGQWGVSLPYGI